MIKCIIKIVFLFWFLFENKKIRNGKMKFRKCKDWKIVRVGKCMDWKTMEKFGNDYNLEIGLGFCR